MVKIIFPWHQLISLFIEKPSYKKNFKSTKIEDKHTGIKDDKTILCSCTLR